MDRDQIMQLIHQGHAARRADDLEGVMAVFDADAEFRLAGSPDHMPVAVDVRGKDDLRQAMAGLIEGFQFQEIEELESVVEPPRAVVRWRARILHRPSGKVVDTELCDIWRFGPGGRAVSLLQFCDTAMVRSLVGGG